MRLTFSFTYLPDLQAVSKSDIFRTYFDLSDEVLKLPDCADRITTIAQAVGQLTEECLFVSCNELGWRNRSIVLIPKRRGNTLLYSSLVLVIAFDEGNKYKGEHRYLNIVAPVIPGIDQQIVMRGRMHRYEMSLDSSLTGLDYLETNLKTPEQLNYLNQIKIIQALCLDLLKFEPRDWHFAGIHPAWLDKRLRAIRNNRMDAAEQEEKKKEKEAKKLLAQQTKAQAKAAEAAKSSKPKKGRIYFIQQGEGGAIKIGYSTNPDKRVMTLQTASPYPLRVLKVIEGGKNKEQELHQLFAHLRMDGEWFQAVEELLQYILELPDS